MRFQGFTEASNLVNFWICGDSQSTGTSSHACSCQHEWVVYSLALAEGWLMLQCVECGLKGTVEDPSNCVKGGKWQCSRTQIASNAVSC